METHYSLLVYSSIWSTKYRIPVLLAIFLNIHLFQPFFFFLMNFSSPEECRQLRRRIRQLSVALQTSVTEASECTEVSLNVPSSPPQHISRNPGLKQQHCISDITGSDMMLLFQYNRASQISITTWVFMQRFETCCWSFQLTRVTWFHTHTLTHLAQKWALHGASFALQKPPSRTSTEHSFLGYAPDCILLVTDQSGNVMAFILTECKASRGTSPSFINTWGGGGRERKEITALS